MLLIVFKSMKLIIDKPLWQVIGLGILAGMRSSAAPVITSHILSHHHSRNLEHTALGVMQSDRVADTLKLIAIGEIIADKLPAAPDRIKPASIAARCISGALAGASVFKASGGKAVWGGLIGAATAAASTYGSFWMRKNAVKRTRIVDPIVGALEDALVIGAGVGLNYAA